MYVDDHQGFINSSGDKTSPLTLLSCIYLVAKLFCIIVFIASEYMLEIRFVFYLLY